VPMQHPMEPDLGHSALKAVVVTLAVVATLLVCGFVGLVLICHGQPAPATPQASGTRTNSPCFDPSDVLISGQCEPPPQTVSVPNFVGATIEYAESHIPLVDGIAWAYATPADGDTCTNGPEGVVATIVAQSPAAGTVLRVSPVNLPTITWTDSCPH
jgi:hypothetical protein